MTYPNLNKQVKEHGKGSAMARLRHKLAVAIYQMLKKEEYHYYMDEQNHSKKMAEYRLFLSQRGIIYKEVFHQIA